MIQYEVATKKQSRHLQRCFVWDSPYECCVFCHAEGDLGNPLRSESYEMKTTIRKTFSKMTARTAAILPAFLVAVPLAAPPDGFNDGIDRTAPNFVTAREEA